MAINFSGHWSFVLGHLSLVICPWSFVLWAPKTEVLAQPNFYLVTNDKRQITYDKGQRLKPSPPAPLPSGERGELHKGQMTNDKGQIAIRQFTVRLMGEQTAGSGVIVARHGQTYTVLTCAHVIAWDGGEELQVMTHDGDTHSATRNHNFDFGDLDLAVVQFTSNQDYPTAPIDGNNPNLALQQPVYVSGFPNSTPNGSKLETGLASLMTSYLMSSGDLVLVLDRPLERGYQIGLSNDIYIGMSGGPVLNHQGYLIAIIGRTKYAFGGSSAYRFADGTEPEPELLSQMESASWAIPIFCHWSFVTCPLSFDK